MGLVVRVYRPIGGAGILLRKDPAFLRLVRSREPAIFVCWHQDFPWTLAALARFQAGRRRTRVLASPSRDGGLAVAAAQAIGFSGFERGSSEARGARALLSMERLARADRRVSFAIVADGPRPPARRLKAGALHLARETGLPIWCIRTSWHPDASMRRTWARFHFPHAFHHGVVVADGPVRVPPDADAATIEVLRVSLEKRMNDLADRSDALARQLWGR